MKTPSDPRNDIGLGKKVEPRPVITPDWMPVPGKPDMYRHKDGRLKYGKPKTQAEQWAETFRKERVWVGF